MNVVSDTKISAERRITGLGIAASIALVGALLVMLVLGLHVGFDAPAWARSSQLERISAAIALGVATGGLFALTADLARQAMR